MAKSVDETVKEIIVEQLGVQEDDVAPTAKFIEELDADDEREARRPYPDPQYLLACAAKAVQDAALATDKVDGTRFGVLVGSGIGGSTTLLETHRVLLEKGPDRVSPFFTPMMIVKM